MFVEVCDATVGTSATNGGEWFRFIIQSVLIFGGWALFIWNASRISSRQETRNLLDKMVALLNLIEEDATEIWLSENKTSLELRFSERAIGFKFRRFEVYSQILSARGIPISLKSEIARLRDACIQDIEKSPTADAGYRHNRQFKLLVCSQETIKTLETVFRSTYEDGFLKWGK